MRFIKEIDSEKSEIYKKAIETEKEHKNTYKKFIDFFEENGKWPSVNQYAEWTVEDHYLEFGDKGDEYYKELWKIEDFLKNGKK